MMAFSSDGPPQVARSLPASPGRGSLRNLQGFSLVELAVVVAALGILAVIAIPFMLNFVQASQTRGAAQELKSLLNHARQLAITQNVQYCVEIGAPQPTNQLRLHQTPGATACTTGAVWLGPGTDSQGWIKLANGAQIVCATANPAFSPLGAATQGATFQVQNAQRTSSLYVTVSVSGRIQTTGTGTCP